LQSEEDDLFINTLELQVKTVIDHDLKELDEWSKKWLMTFNSDKTEIMLFSNTDIPGFNFTFNERTIPITNSHKHLGVTFSSDAKWSSLLEFPTPQLSHTSQAYSKIGLI
jgi:hypothetical protein